MIGRITRDAKHAGKRSAGNSHAPFDAAGAGNVAWSRSCDTRRRKSERTGNTNFDLHQRASPRPYCQARSVASAMRAPNDDRSGTRTLAHPAVRDTRALALVAVLRESSGGGARFGAHATHRRAASRVPVLRLAAAARSAA